MPLTVACPSCSARLAAPDAAAGKRIRCPKCQAAVPVPADDGFEVVDAPVPPRAKPVTKKPVIVDEEEEDDRPRKKRRRDDDDDDDRPRRRDRVEERTGVPMIRNIIMGVVLLVLIGVAGYVFYTKLKDADADPPKAAPGAIVPAKE